MSARERRIVLKPQARVDVRGALLQSRRQWGADQRLRYKTMLYDALPGLGDHPERGRMRDNLFPGRRSLPGGRHVRFYHVSQDGIAIVRVLHRRQDAEAEVSTPGP